MRILHTADWHVGKLLRGRSRQPEHRAVLDEIAGIVAAEAVDLVLVAGDLFETAAPTPEAEAEVYRALLALADTGATVVVVAGNHDNPQRLAAVAPFAALGRIHLAATLARPDDGGVVRIATPSGDAVVALVPFVSQRGVVRAETLLDLAPDQRSGHYADRVQRIVAMLTDGFDAGAVNVVLAHLFVAGGTLGGGERSAHTIFDYSVPASTFPVDAHYVALGHLHRAQTFPGTVPVRYAGSPLQLDFGETADAKSVTLVDAAPGTPAQVREIPLRAGRPLRTLAGTLDELHALRDHAGDAWLRIDVHEAVRAGLADEVRAWFPDAVEVRVVRPQAEGAAAPRSRQGRSATELFGEFCQAEGVDDPRVGALFAELLDEAHTARDHAGLLVDAGVDAAGLVGEG